MEKLKTNTSQHNCISKQIYRSCIYQVYQAFGLVGPWKGCGVEDVFSIYLSSVIQHLAILTNKNFGGGGERSKLNSQTCSSSMPKCNATLIHQCFTYFTTLDIVCEHCKYFNTSLSYTIHCSSWECRREYKMSSLETSFQYVYIYLYIVLYT